MQAAVVDTNLLVAVMVEDDSNHTKAIKIWEGLQKAYVPTVALFELAFFLVKHELGLDLLGKVVTDPKVEVVPNNLEDILYLSRRGGEVKYYDDVGDLMILSTAKRLGTELKTFDEDLRDLASD